jgi:hypothetical protein
MSSSLFKEADIANFVLAASNKIVQESTVFTFTFDIPNIIPSISGLTKPAFHIFFPLTITNNLSNTPADFKATITSGTGPIGFSA